MGHSHTVAVPPDALLDEEVVPRRRVDDGQHEDDAEPEKGDAAPRRGGTEVSEDPEDEDRGNDEQEVKPQVRLRCHRRSGIAAPV